MMIAAFLLAFTTAGTDSPEQVPVPEWIDWDQDGIQDLAIRLADGRLLLLQGSANGKLLAHPIPLCDDGIKDVSNANNCLRASSAPTLGMLLPLGNPISVLPSGNVGIGNASPGQRLAVQGQLQLLSGGLLFPDGSSLTTSTPVGPQGIQGIPGPQGPQGPVGLQGPQGPITAMPSINQKTGAITIAGAGLVLVSTSAATGEVTLSIGPNKCNWGGKLYSPGAQCFVTPTHTGCSGGAWTATPKTCQSNLSWSTSPQVICQGQAPSPICGQ